MASPRCCMPRSEGSSVARLWSSARVTRKLRRQCGMQVCTARMCSRRNISKERRRYALSGCRTTTRAHKRRARCSKGNTRSNRDTEQVLDDASDGVGHAHGCGDDDQVRHDRRLMFIPERKASKVETSMMTVPAVSM